MKTLFCLITFVFIVGYHADSASDERNGSANRIGNRPVVEFVDQTDLLALVNVLSREAVQRKIELASDRALDMGAISPLGFLTVLNVEKIFYASYTNDPPKKIYIYEDAAKLARHRPKFQINNQYVLFLKRETVPPIANLRDQLSFTMPSNDYYSVVLGQSGQFLAESSESEKAMRLFLQEITKK